MTDTTNPELELGATDNEDLEVAKSVATPDESGTVGTEQKADMTVDEALEAAFAKHTDPATAKAATAPQNAPTAAPATEVKAVDPVTGRELDAIKPPASATPGIRDEWKNVPRKTQQYIVDRERDMSTRLNESAEERKLASQYKEIAQPYEAALRQFGITAPQLTKDLMTQWNTLATGPSHAKAQVIDSIIRHFGKNDPAMIDAIGQLAQGLPMQHTQQQAPQSVDVQAEFNKLMAAREEQITNTQTQSDIDRFAADPKNEFFNDVRVVMGKAIDAGLIDAPTLPEVFAKAYDLACQQNPEIRAILASRVTSPVAPVSSTTHLAKPVAQIKPSLGGNKTGKTPSKSMNIDEALNAAFKTHGY